MALTRVDIQVLQQAIRALPRLERAELAEWILNSPGLDERVEEAVPADGRSRNLTVEEYLQLEEESDLRHEYVRGQVFAMTSPVNRHEMIAINVLGHFYNQLRSGPCRALASRTKVRLQVDQEDIIYRPDVTVVCGPFTEDVLDARYFTDPCIVVEVLSASTEAIDRREKALNYRHISSLEEYLVIAQRSMEVTVFRREENWIPRVLTAPEEVFESRALEVNIALADIYEGIR